MLWILFFLGCISFMCELKWNKMEWKIINLLVQQLVGQPQKYWPVLQSYCSFQLITVCYLFALVFFICLLIEFILPVGFCFGHCLFSRYILWLAVLSVVRLIVFIAVEKISARNQGSLLYCYVFLGRSSCAAKQRDNRSSNYCIIGGKTYVRLSEMLCAWTIDSNWS